MGKRIYNIAHKEDGKEYNIYLYGEIYGEKIWDEDVTPQELVDIIEIANKYSIVNIYVNSAGGEVWAGMSIYNMIKRIKSETRAYIDGLSASIASVISLAADKVYAYKNSMFMIHNPSIVTMGDSKDLRKTADLLDKVKETIISVYLDKIDTSYQEISQLMDEESWFTGEEAFALGFLDGIIEDKQTDIKNTLNHIIINGIEIDKNRFKNIPENFKKVTDEPQEPIENLLDYSYYENELKLIETYK